ncbi:MAG TPA: DUF998 domain-containing protein [Candidatus Dojkabacteria bacterium]|nr:DUF998 domain-containing protein [Candidatus Dojkabacteria bacterium]
MKKYLGFINLIIFSISIFVCLQLYPEFDFFKDTFSYLGTLKQTAVIFNLTMIFLGISNFFYLNFIIESYKLKGSSQDVLKIIINLVILSLFMVGLIPLNLNENLHYLFAFILFYGLAVGIVFFGIVIAPKNLLFSRFNIGFGIFMILIFSILNGALKTNAFNESVYLFLLTLWIFTLFFINPNKNKVIAKY